MSNQTTGVNKLLLLSTLLLMSFGIVVVYTACTQHAIRMGLAPEYYLKKHSMMVLASLMVMFFAAKIDYSVWKKFSRVIFVGGCALTVYCLIFGTAHLGAKRWVNLGFFQLQPSEVLKFGLIVMIAVKLSEAGSEIKTLKCSLIQPGIPFAIAAVLLILQPNFSMLIMFSCIVVSMLLVAGVNFKHLLPALGGGALMGVIMLLVKSHSSKRIAAFLDPSTHQDSAYQAERSLEALGNGGFFGTGVGMGMQKLGYLPEAHKDVVFSVIGEEFGFVGTLAVLLVFAVLFYQGFEIARNSSTRFGKYMAVALTISLFLNFIVHVCVSTGLIPTTGQPLPFLSFGGTNLIISGLFIGILLNISKSGTGKKIDEPYVGGEKTNVYTFGGFDIARAE